MLCLYLPIRTMDALDPAAPSCLVCKLEAGEANRSHLGRQPSFSLCLGCAQRGSIVNCVFHWACKFVIPSDISTMCQPVRNLSASIRILFHEGFQYKRYRVTISPHDKFTTSAACQHGTSRHEPPRGKTFHLTDTALLRRNGVLLAC